MKFILLFLTSIAAFVFTFIVPTLEAKFICLIGSLLLFRLGIYMINQSEKKRTAELEQEVDDLLQHLPFTHKTISDDYLQALFIDEASQTLFTAIRKDTGESFDVKEYLFPEVYEAAIEEDGNQLAFIARGGILGGSLLKNVDHIEVFDTQKEDDDLNDEDFSEEEQDDIEEGISKVSLKLVLDNLAHPIFEFIFFESEEPVDPDSDEYKDAFKACNQWYQMISILIKRQDHQKQVLVTRYEEAQKVI
ncbi:hypothetical protein M2M59_08445 [Rummeliibacillus sp. G93]|uniref:hypothetical protein n=1 Tax=Rummeliibacillus TaxID=648802 RepID=UPI00116F1E6E|nr:MULTISPECIES: hypothetical protein [Rummeliibacillus]MBB5169207.1 hypothetical protein [Rummeliibacillus stabekisii]UQW96050.1 hypothetical protein M2M59_08445 [Rummeliibacillus sp. G93]GEL03468.1 hypothetical protein RST01_00950 [Rummeliibacillus stabekisii]